MFEDYPEIIYEILSSMGDLDLEVMCVTDKFINNICNDDYLYRLKIEKKYGNLSINQEGDTYKDLYYTLKYQNKTENDIKLNKLIRDSVMSDYEDNQLVFNVLKKSNNII